jgi:cytochrome oxidase Cu insertion factor (SCO1/SenC/PrrC family)
MLTVLRGAFAFPLIMASTFVVAHDAHLHDLSVGESKDPAPAYAFPLPAPGTYELPPIMAAAGGYVLDEKGRNHDLEQLLRGHVTVLAFIYTRCGDVCPTASLQLSLLQDLAAAAPEVANRMQLLSMSFDPDYDKPAVMAEYARAWRSAKKEAPEWQFLTAPDRVTLAPLLVAYNQSIGPKPNKSSSFHEFYHIFRAFLIDRSGQVRNIYSLDFLDPKLVMTDINTLLLEEKRAPSIK